MPVGYSSGCRTFLVQHTKAYKSTVVRVFIRSMPWIGNEEFVRQLVTKAHDSLFDGCGSLILTYDLSEECCCRSNDPLLTCKHCQQFNNFVEALLLLGYHGWTRDIK